MKTAQSLSDPEKIKLLTDARRRQILRLLMEAPATLTQLAARLAHSPAWVRHHVEKLRAAGLVELDSIQRKGTVTEKYYRAAADALIIQQTILPQSRLPVILLSGSHDLALEGLADYLKPWMHLVLYPVGSLNGLVHLRQGLSHLSGLHLRNPQGGYNSAYIRHFFPDREMYLVTLAQRTQGLILPPGNPKAVRGLEDLLREDIRFINRNAGSGTRLWLDAALRRQSLAPRRIRGYETCVSTHRQAAERVFNGQADVAVGLEAAAHLHGLAFLPLFSERFDLVMERSQAKMLAPLLDAVNSAAFRQLLRDTAGYDFSHSGELISLQEVSQ